MNFKNISNQDFHLRLEKLARTERKLTHHILLHIIEVEIRKLYLELGFESIYSYLTKGLRYSESAAYRRIQAARLLKSSSSEMATNLAEKLEAGTLHLSQLTQVQKCLQDEKKKGTVIGQQKVTEIIQSIESKSMFESEKILAKEFNFNIKTLESAKPQKDESVRIELTLSKDQFAKLEQAKSLLSHQCPEGSWSEVLTLLAEKLICSKLGKGQACTSPGAESGFQIQPHGQVEVSQDDRKTRPKMPQLKRTLVFKQRNTDSEVERYRSAISLKLKRRLLANAQNHCEFVDIKTGQRCGSKFQLEIDHRKPLALGGEDSPANLRILCRAHNQWAWQQSLGVGKVTQRKHLKT